MSLFFSTFLLYLLSNNFYLIKGNPLLLLNIEGGDAIFFIGISIIIANFRIIKKVNYENNKLILFFLLYCFISSIIMAGINFNQPLIFSLRASRIFIIYLVLFYTILINTYNKNLKTKITFKVFNYITIFICLINIYIFSSGNTEIIDGLVIQSRFEDVRFMVGGDSVIYLTIFYLFNLKESKFNYIYLLILICVLLFISKTRGILIPISICFVYSFVIKEKINQSIKNIFILVLIFLLIVIVGKSNVVINSIQKLIEFTSNDISKESGNVGFRFIELNYFINKLDSVSFLFGYGIDNQKYIEMYNEGYVSYYLSDLGVFRIIYYNGIIGFLIYARFLYVLYKESRKGETSIHKLAYGFVLFQLFSSLTLSFLYSIESFFIFCLIYALLKHKNNEIQNEKLVILKNGK